MRDLARRISNSVEGVNSHIGTRLASRSFGLKMLASLLVVSLSISSFYGLGSLFHTPSVKAASTGARTATSTSDCVNDASVGTIAWASPGNAANVNGFNATVSNSGAIITNYLKCTNFGFDTVIPAGSTIDGIVLTVGRSKGVFNNVTDNAVRLVKGGVVGSTDKKSATVWPTSMTEATYGGTSDLWGDTWSLADVTSSSFGAVVSASLDSGFSTTQANIDYMQLTVHYTAPPVTLEQSGFRFFENADSTNVGTPLAALNTSTTLTSASQAFRLRNLVHVELNPLIAGQLELQYVDQGSGSCALPSGGTPSTWTPIGARYPGAVWTQVTPSIHINTTQIPYMAELNGTFFLQINGSMYTSADGSTWVLRNSPPGSSLAMPLLTFDNKVWLIGGQAFSGGVITSDDVYYTTDGINYSTATTSAGWGARNFHGVAVFDSKMWVIGGSTATSGSTGNLNDVWSSADGITWTQETAAANWTARHYFGTAVKDGKLWVMAGSDGGSTMYGDVWSSADGITWTQETAAADWTARRGPGLTVLDDQFILAGGGTSSSGSSGQQDVWVSTDGIDWDLVTNTPGWGGKTYPALVNNGGTLWLYGGTDTSGSGTNDLWRAEPTSLIAFNDNETPVDGAALTANGNDPTHSSDNVVGQNYYESNPISVDAQIDPGEDGMWDFSLVDNGAPAGTTYCFRLVYSDGTEFDTYTYYPAITTFSGASTSPTPQLHQRLHGGNWWAEGVRQLLILE